MQLSVDSEGFVIVFISFFRTTVENRHQRTEVITPTTVISRRTIQLAIFLSLYL